MLHLSHKWELRFISIRGDNLKIHPQFPLIGPNLAFKFRVDFIRTLKTKNQFLY